MPDAATLSWSDLHDLALIYLVLLHRPGRPSARSGEVPAPLQAAARRHLAHFYPDAGEARLRRVLHDALIMYVGIGGAPMLDVSVASLRRALPRPYRAAVLDDLAGLAESEGDLLPGRMAFLQDLAYHWDLDGVEW